jgi:hypothetical protein
VELEKMMSAIINWQVTKTDYLVSDGFITTAHWTATATDGDYTASIYSTCSWADGSPTVPYADVTESEVLQWVWDSGVSKEATEAALAQNIALQKNPVTATGTPWSAAA